MWWPLYVVAILISLTALVWAALLAYQRREGHFYILASLIGLILLRESLDLAGSLGSTSLNTPWNELASIAVSSLVALAVGWERRRFQREHLDSMERRRMAEELHTSQVRFAGIVDIAEDGIITVNARHQIVQFNRGAEKIFGYALAEVLGQSLNLLIPARFVADHPKRMDEFARGNLTSRRMAERSEVYGLRKDGKEFPADISISKLELNGEMLFTAIVRDATERRRYEEQMRTWNQELEQNVVARTAELAESNRQLARKSEENETFVYSVSHDLRSPLVNLQGFSQELKQVNGDLRRLLANDEVPVLVREQAAKMMDHDMTESITYIETAVARLSGIIDALLRLSRAGRVEYQQQRVDLAPVVQRVVTALQATIEQKGAEVVIRDLPPARGDAIAIEQVFANLIANALNYLDPQRPGRIEIGSHRNADSDPKLNTYYVRDNGLGIPAAYASQLFQAFRRLHPEAAPGEGMGLAIVRRVVERNGGTVWAESSEGQGTTFFVTLPAEPAEKLREDANAT